MEFLTILDFSVFDYAYRTIRERYENHGDEQGFEIISTETITEEQYQKETATQEVGNA